MHTSDQNRHVKIIEFCISPIVCYNIVIMGRDVDQDWLSSLHQGTKEYWYMEHFDLGCYPISHYYHYSKGPGVIINIYMTRLNDAR